MFDTEGNMTSAKKSPRKKADHLQITAKPGVDEATQLAQTILEPSVSNGLALIKLVNVSTPEGGGLSIVGLVDALRQQCEATNKGDLGRGEAMLTAQAHTLDALFTHLVERATSNFGQYIGAADTYMRLALKAQSQCRTTWEAIAEMKNPRAVAFVRQANIAAGPQQVNNAAVPAVAPPRAENSENPPSKLLEAQDDERLDTRTASTASGADTELETVGAIDRTTDTGG